MIGEIQFTVVEEGNLYRLSNGTELAFLSPINPDGVTNEELIGVLLHRLRVQGRQKPTKCTSRAITKLEEAEECLWRRVIEKTPAERSTHVV